MTRLAPRLTLMFLAFPDSALFSLFTCLPPLPYAKQREGAAHDTPNHHTRPLPDAPTHRPAASHAPAVPLCRTAQPGAGVGTQLCPADSALREQAQTLEAVLALLALHPSDAYRRHLMQGLLGLQQQQQQLLA